MGYTPPYPAYYAPSNYPPGYQMGKAGQYPPTQGSAPPQQQGYGVQGYVAAGQGYGGGQPGTAYGGGSGQQQQQQQQFSNPNYQYYIGTNPPK
jgi:hypothetical protein